MCRCFFSGHARMHVDLHVYLVSKLVEHSHQTVNGEAVKLYVTNAGKVRMTDTATILSLPLARRKPFIVENANDACGQKRLGPPHVGVSAAEIPKHVAAAIHRLRIFFCPAHWRDPF